MASTPIKVTSGADFEAAKPKEVISATPAPPAPIHADAKITAETPPDVAAAIAKLAEERDAFLAEKAEFEKARQKSEDAAAAREKDETVLRERIVQSQKIAEKEAPGAVNAPVAVRHISDFDKAGIEYRGKPEQLSELD